MIYIIILEIKIESIINITIVILRALHRFFFSIQSIIFLFKQNYTFSIRKILQIEIKKFIERAKQVNDSLIYYKYQIK